MSSGGNLDKPVDKTLGSPAGDDYKRCLKCVKGFCKSYRVFLHA